MSVDKECVWGPWGSYDECRSSYSGSNECMRKRTRRIRLRPMHGGTPCYRNDGKEEETCECPGKIAK